MLNQPCHLLSSNYSENTTRIRPPWSLTELEFISQCDQCGACIDACNKHILISGKGGYPEVDFSRNGCDFCGDCLQACSSSVANNVTINPWPLAAFFSRSCVTTEGTACSNCADTCTSHAINFRLSVADVASPILNQSLCTGCGHCVSVCPSDAVYMVHLIQEGSLTS